MVSLRKRPRQERIDRLTERWFSRMEIAIRQAKGRKPWLQKKLQRFKAMIAVIEGEQREEHGRTDLDWRSLGHGRAWRTIKARRRRRQRDAAAERRAMARYFAARPGLDVIEEGRLAWEKKRRKRQGARRSTAECWP